MMNQFRVYEPEENTILYEAVEGGFWAYIKEIPTTRAFGKTEDDACLNLLTLVLEGRS
jgi:predicted RNase H-like HicB family nuclease